VGSSTSPFPGRHQAHAVQMCGGKLPREVH
jgi:hypothetical protein